MIVGVNGGGKTTSLGKSRIELLIFGFELNFGKTRVNFLSYQNIYLSQSNECQLFNGFW